MQFATSRSEASTTSDAVTEASDALAHRLTDGPSLVIVSYTEDHLPDVLRTHLKARFPDSMIIGSSSCRGFLTEDGLFGFGTPALGLAALHDPDGAYGTATTAFGDDPEGATARAVLAAQTAAERVGEMPDLVWMHASPGSEEQAITALRRVLGQDVLIAGGSSADETIGGRWSQFNADESSGNGLALGLFYSEHPITHHFQNGYLPTDQSGIVTRAAGRVLGEIDGKPAAQVYNSWTGGAIRTALEDNSVSILGTSSWTPLGKSIGQIGPSSELMVDCYCLLHPDSVGPKDELNLFANVEEGERIVMMQSGQSELINRAAQVVRTSLDMARGDAAPQGALMVFCAGCMLALGDEIETAARDIVAAFEGTPFLCIFTFGEQGSFLNGERQHGNLMISSTVLNGPAVAAHDAV